ncbi:MAG TPA: hypothetical protein VJ256_00525 [Dehalococcoidia bacterium]|nr:hypothetical protein [Dehalococcoidia bacterium]HLB29657.1 hypothetical protein [Dehalococcoidia bacterium]
MLARHALAQRASIRRIKQGMPVAQGDDLPAHEEPDEDDNDPQKLGQVEVFML